MTDNELYHYGVKGMKWGVRKSKSTSSGSKINKRKNTSSGPRTNWGKNRAYAKKQDALNEARWQKTKQQVKSGELSKNSAKYKKEKTRYNTYNEMRSNYTFKSNMTKAARGKRMKKLGITAAKPYSSVKPSKALILSLQSAIKQEAKIKVASVVVSIAASVGAAYLKQRASINTDNNGIPRLNKSDMINLKPWQYKVK